MSRHLAPLGLALLVACSAPDVTEEAKVFADAVSAGSDAIAPAIERDAVREVEAAKAAMIAQGSAAKRPVYARPAQCTALAETPLEADFADCRLLPNFEVLAVEGSGVYYRRALSALESYGAVLRSLAGSTSHAEIGKNFSGFLTSINGFATAVNARGDTDPVDVDHIQPLGQIGTAIADARRGRAIRRLVRDAHEPLRRVLKELIAYEQRRGALDADVEALDDAYFRMQTAHNSGDVGAYRRAVAAYESQLSAYRKAVQGSATGELAAIWQAQRALRIRVDQPGDPEALVDILENIKALSE